MDKAMKSKIAVAFPTNVRILSRDSKTEGLIRDLTVKNMVLKEYGLYSYMRFILGSFNNGSIWDWNQYVPKYLAVGSNQAPMTGYPGTETTTQITDLSLFHELDDSTQTGESPENNRIKLNRANYIEDNEQENYLKVQFEAYIPEDRYVGMTIGEMALMTMNKGWNAYARITGFEPFVKSKHEVIQVIWEISIISIESSDRFKPLVKQYLLEAIEKAINVLQVDKEDPVGLKGARVALDKLIEPSTNLGTGMYYLLNENNMITQDIINNYLSKPYISLDNTGLIPLINRFPSGKNWQPSSYVVD